MFTSSSCLSLLLDDSRHFFSLSLGTDVGTQSLLQESKTSLIWRYFITWCTSAWYCKTSMSYPWRHGAIQVLYVRMGRNPWLHGQSLWWTYSSWFPFRVDESVLVRQCSWSLFQFYIVPNHNVTKPTRAEKTNKNAILLSLAIPVGWFYVI